MMLDRPAFRDDHRRYPTEHRCPCAGELAQLEASTLLTCPKCGEPRFLVPASP